MEIQIHITPNDIINGVRESNSCPISLAIKRVFGKRHDKRVACMASDWIKFDDQSEAWLPANAQKFIADFDAGRPVEPFSFKIVPEVSVEFAA